MKHADIESALEALVDMTCADTVIECLTRVLSEKAEHISANYGEDDIDAAAFAAVAADLANVQNRGV